MKIKETGVIPPQETGVQSNTESSAEFETAEEARRFFEVARSRLMQVNKWHDLAGALTADFQLTDSNGKEVNREAGEGDHFKIDIPGPGPATGDGFDWVQVERIEETNEPDRQSVAICVRPATNPHNDRKDVAHFFSEEATGCFMVQRENNVVTAGVYGRNEKPNTEAEMMADKARNTAVATGAVSGFSKLQWKSLVNGFVKKEE
jgi:hypothetical protein